MSTREFLVKLRGLSGDALFRAWLDKRPREVSSPEEAAKVLDRL